MMPSVLRFRPSTMGRLAVAMVAAGLAAATGGTDFRTWCAGKADAAGQAGTATIVGKDGWLFLDKDLRHIGRGDFPQAAPAADRDPVAAIADFAKHLDAAGVKLILVPVPPKPLVQAEETGGPLEAPEGLLAPLRALYGKLKEQGVAVLDLADAFRAARGDGGAPVYCRTDTHWSGRGIELAAARMAAALGEIGVKPAGRHAFKVEKKTVEIAGDLAAGVTPPAPKESLGLAFVSDAADGAPPADDRASPVLLLGDSHVLVFHAGGDMHAQGAGVADHLAKEWGAPVDLLGVRGSGATTCRISLYRRAKADPAYLAGKKVVIWCLAAREFTEADKWMKVPVR